MIVSSCLSGYFLFHIEWNSDSMFFSSAAVCHNGPKEQLPAEIVDGNGNFEILLLTFHRVCCQLLVIFIKTLKNFPVMKVNSQLRRLCKSRFFEICTLCNFIR